MKATLVIPRPAIAGTDGEIIRSQATYRWRLRWTDHHPASRYGAGVLLSPNNEVFDGVMFRHLRDSVGAWIKTDDPPRVCAALGLPDGEEGIR